MITEQDILDSGFERLDYSTDLIQYYILDIVRSKKYKAYDAHTEVIIEIESAEENPNRIFSKLKLGQHFGTSTKAWIGTLEDKEDLDAKLQSILYWNLTH
jgi:hypothetical protein